MKRNRNILNTYKDKTIVGALSIVLILAIGAFAPVFAQDDGDFVPPPEDSSQGADQHAVIEVNSNYLANEGDDFPSPPSEDPLSLEGYTLAASLPVRVGNWTFNMNLNERSDLEFRARGARFDGVFYLSAEQGQWFPESLLFKDNGDGTVNVALLFGVIPGPINGGPWSRRQ